MAVRIVTDGSCDIDPSLQAERGIRILPLRVFFGEQAYVEGENLTREEFYEKLAEARELPKTAQITPVEFEDVFRPIVEAGDGVVVLPISRELSGTYQSALIAKEAFPGADIYVVDTQAVTFSLALLVERAAELRDQGKSAAEIARQIEALVPRVRLYAVIDDLKYLRMGGRLSTAGAVVGSLLGIKPIIALQGGKVVNIGKTRGLKAAYDDLSDRAVREMEEGQPLYFGHSHAPDREAELEEALRSRIPLPERRLMAIGSVVGTHAGPGCTGLAFVAKNDG